MVADGLRWQEVFRGADSLLLFGSSDTPSAERARRAFWSASRDQRRAALMPFVWETMAAQGRVLGDRDAGSVVRVTNAMWFSYPGYNEMLSGRPDPRIDRNDYGPNPNVTVFEWLSARAGFRGRVAVAGTWSTFRDIFNEDRSGLPIEVGDTDRETHGSAMALFRTLKPRALFVGFGETDDLAHKGRYDLVLDAAHRIDRAAGEFWAAAQAHPAYRGRTTLILVADHGRGRTPRDWTDHGPEIPGADETWLAVIGPLASAGARDGAPVTLSQVAATVAAAVGEDFASAARGIAPPVFLPGRARD